jgi:hypothetical protein
MFSRVKRNIKIVSISASIIRHSGREQHRAVPLLVKNGFLHTQQRKRNSLFIRLEAATQSSRLLRERLFKHQRPNLFVSHRNREEATGPIVTFHPAIMPSPSSDVTVPNLKWPLADYIRVLACITYVGETYWVACDKHASKTRSRS